MTWKSYPSIEAGYNITKLSAHGGGLEIEVSSKNKKTVFKFDDLVEYRVSLESDVWVSMPEDFGMPSGYSESSIYIDDFISRCDPVRVPQVIFHSIFSDVAVVVEVLSQTLPDITDQ